MIKQLWKPRYNTLQVYLIYFPIELQSIYFSGILTKILAVPWTVEILPQNGRF